MRLQFLHILIIMILAHAIAGVGTAQAAAFNASNQMNETLPSFSESSSIDEDCLAKLAFDLNENKQNQENSGAGSQPPLLPSISAMTGGSAGAGLATDRPDLPPRDKCIGHLESQFVIPDGFSDGIFRPPRA